MRDRGIQRRQLQGLGPIQDGPGLGPVMRAGFWAGLLAGITLGGLYVVRNGPPLELAAFPIPWGLKMAVPLLVGGIGGAAWGAVGGAIGGGSEADTNSAIFSGMVAATIALVLFTVTQNVHELAKLAYAGVSIVVLFIVVPLAFGSDPVK